MYRRIASLLLLACALAGCESVRPPVAQRAAVAPAEPSALPSRPAAPTQADFVLVDKSDRTLTLYVDGRPFKTYRGLQFGGAPMGHKHFEGDERTPQGRYWIDYRNPASAYHLSLHISYPNAADAAYARGRGRSPGGEIFIHGQPNWLTSGRLSGDWTDGCIALSDAQIEELWSAIPDGTPIEIRP